MRILVDALLGLRNTDQIEQLGCALERLLLGVAAVKAKALAHLLADLINRVQRGHGILEDHRDVVTANMLHLLLGHIEERVTAIQDAAALDLSRRHGDEAHDGHRGHGLTGTGLADDAEGLATIERIGDAVDGMDDTVLGMEVHLEIIDLEEMLALGNGLRLQVDVVLLILLHGFTHPSS